MTFNANFIKIIGPEPKLNEEEAAVMKLVEEAEANKEMNVDSEPAKTKELLGLGFNISEEFFIIGGVLAFAVFAVFYYTRRDELIERKIE